MEERTLKRLHRKFLAYAKKSFLRDARLWMGTEHLALDKKTLEAMFENHERVSYLSFVTRVKSLVSGKTIFEYTASQSTDHSNMHLLVDFLASENIIAVKKDGSIRLIDRVAFNPIPEAVSAAQAKERIEKLLGRRLDPAEPAGSLFAHRSQAAYDQMSISIASALFLTERISHYLPLKRTFLLAGDDDFMSVFLTTALPGVECTVIDIDERLLASIDEAAQTHRLPIRTQKADFRKKQELKERFAGFLVNPPYHLPGVVQFVRFCTSQLGTEGGFGFVPIGDEAIGNRFLALQKFFAQENLIIREMSPEAIAYPWVSLHEEDKTITKRVSKFVDNRTIEANQKLGASLWVFEYVPFPVKNLSLKGSLYAYL